MKGIFFYTAQINIKKYCYIGPGAEWFGFGGIDIGDGTIIGPKSVIWTADHNYNSESLAPYDKKIIKKKVSIGRGCWLGYGVKVSPGVSIGDGVVVAIGSVVTKNVDSYAIVGGNPAKVIGHRQEGDATRLLIESEKFYMKDKNEKL
jgi:acetyltransferase-like isoleucine patch superfamily enzyme